MGAGSRPGPERPDQFAVTFVCTGNRARSPVAQELLRRYVARRDVSVDSLGTLNLGPLPALPEAADAAAALGIDLSKHRARPLRAGGLVGVDLVVGFEPTHIATAVVDGGAARERCFTIVELAGVLEASQPGADASSAAAILESAHAHRGDNPLSAPSVPDPFGGSAADFRNMVETVDRLVAVIARNLFRVSAESPSSTRPPSGWRGLVERLRSG